VRRLALVPFLFAGCLFPSLGDLEGNDASLDAPKDTPNDTAADAGVDGPFCSGDAHTFCVDFDEHPLAVDWTSIANPGGTTVQLDDAAFESAPNSLLTRVDSDASVFASVMKKFYGAQSQMIAAFDVNVAALDATVQQYLFEVGGEDSAGNGCVFMVRAITGSSDVQLQSYTPNTDTGDTFIPLDAPLVAATWTHVEARLVGSLTNMTALEIYFDGKPVASDPQFKSSLVTACPMSSFVFLRLGYWFSKGTNLVEHFDNVTADVN
jgi:hypothetical protein